MKLENQSGHRIRAARNMRDPKWTQDEVLAKMHTRHHMVFTRNTISRIETGQRYVTDLELIAFADVLQVSTAWLLGETFDPTPKKKY